MLEITKIKELAKEKGITSSFICSKLGLNRGYLKDIANGKGVIPEDRLQAIADILGTTVDYLHGKTDEKNKPTENGRLNDMQKETINAFLELPPEAQKAFYELVKGYKGQSK